MLSTVLVFGIADRRVLTDTPPSTAGEPSPLAKVQVTCRAPSALLAVGHVNGVTIHSQGRFMKRLGKRRVRKHHHAQVFGTGAEFHGDGALLDQLGRARADDVYAQYAVGLGAGDDLDETTGVVGSHGAATGSEGEHADVDINAFGLQLLFVLANPGGFGVGVDDGRDQIVVHLGLVTGDALGDNHALFRGLMRQHQATHHVTDGVDARYRGSAVIVDVDIAALVQGNTGVGSQQIGGDRTTANSNDQLVEGHFLITLGISELDGDFFALDLTAGDARTQQYLQA